MVLIITFINVLLLYVGVNAIIKKITAGDSRALTILTSAITLIITLSFLYYLMLLLNLGFSALLILLTIINLTNIYFNKDLLKKYRFKLLNNNHIWALAAVFFLTCYFLLYAGKYGSWDAWAIWNLHAKFLYQTESWRHMFSKDLAYSHLDYPLMLPSIVAFLWNGIGKASPFVPLLLSYGLLLAVPLYTYFSLRDAGLKWLPYVALAIFVVDNNFKELAISQCADTLLALLILMVFVQYNKLRNGDDKRALLLGFICASCAWVKNEGLVFYILFSLCFIAANYKQLAILKKYFAGVILPTLVMVSFKLLFAPANDLVSADNKHLSSISAVLTDVGRYTTILEFWVTTLINYYLYILILIFVVFILSRKLFRMLPAVVIAALLLAYFVIYLITPHDLKWHLSTSVSRVFLHVYPAIVYLTLSSIIEVKESPILQGDLKS
ncbi:MAG: hypothetical protein ABIN13_06055 [Mucilaginibacter sp.]